MTDLERKLAEALREQAGEVTPNLDAAWAEQRRRQRRPPRRRRVAVWSAPLAAVLVVLTSVLLATELNRVSAPAPPANPEQVVILSPPRHRAMAELKMTSAPVRLMDFAGPTGTWTAHAFLAEPIAGRRDALFCVAAVPEDRALDLVSPQFGSRSPDCVPMTDAVMRAGYLGRADGPLPPWVAVYLVRTTDEDLLLYNAEGDLIHGSRVAVVGRDRVFLAGVDAGSPPLRFQVS
ncbi:hypothetical protein [Amycolatopsis sp. NPDC021455]|uniref:hypothetical protein n=1 Tax=Amycolatopsis sp. NPDC021455 TaxID=3154901 RepID=UPI0033C2567C